MGTFNRFCLRCFVFFILINNDQRESFQEAATIVARTRRSLITRRLYSLCDTDEKRRQKTQKKNKDGNFGAVTRVEKQYREREFSNINSKLTDMEKERKGNTNTKGAAAREKATPLLRQPSRD